MSSITSYLGPYIEVRTQWHPVELVERPPDLFKVLGNDSLRTLGPSQVVNSVSVTRIVPKEHPDLEDQRDEQHWLDIAFASEIEEIMEAYGPSNVSFHWGSIVNTAD